MIPARTVQSPKLSLSTRSREYRLIIGLRMAKISGSVTDSTVPSIRVVEHDGGGEGIPR